MLAGLASASACVCILAARARADPVIAAAGDIACDTTSEFYNGGAGVEGHCRQRATSDLLLQLGLSAVLPVGDTQYHVGALSDYMASFDPTWGRLKSIMHPAVGNHEYGTAGARGYFDYFNGVGNQAGRGRPRQGLLQLRRRRLAPDRAEHGVRSGRQGIGPEGCEEDSPQERWLRSDLAAHRSSCTLAYWHSPRFNSGYRATHPSPSLLGGAPRRRRRRDPQRRRAQLRALRSPGPRGNRPRKGHPRVRRRHRRCLLHRVEQAEGQQRGAPEQHLRRARARPCIRGATSGGSTRGRQDVHRLGSGACHGRTPGFAVPAPPVEVAGRRRCTIRGTNGKDRLVGTPKKDVICGRGGNDTIRGLGGNDVIRAGAGRDRVYGGSGNDRLYGSAGNDRHPWPERPRPPGRRSGRDRLDGDRGNDSISARDSGRRDSWREARAGTRPGSTGRPHALGRARLVAARGIGTATS